MSMAQFVPDAWDASGCPAWISALATEDPNHLVHVVRDLEPPAALELLGAERDSIAPCELPVATADERTSLLRAAISPADPSAVLLAGRIGEWTFVYDDLGLTLGLWDGAKPLDAAAVLSAQGKAAATGYSAITGHAGLLYAVDGELVVNQELFDPAELDGDSPAEVRTAVELAGAFETRFDDYLGMRAVCVLAGLPRTLDDLRKVALLIAPLD
ncbi:hypothetical protein ACFQ68_16310 [Amycolatopsis japonica]|uniref:hypothetical protein n=1 Tax=Amycolatopsis japonica TaxID=208439 RepID=UPI003671E857